MKTSEEILKEMAGQVSQELLLKIADFVRAIIYEVIVTTSQKEGISDEAIIEKVKEANDILLKKFKGLLEILALLEIMPDQKYKT